MSQFYSSIHRAGISNRDSEGMWLFDTMAAKAHALQVVRELKEDGGYEDPELFISVEDCDGRIILSLPFSETACSHPN